MFANAHLVGLERVFPKEGNFSESITNVDKQFQENCNGLGVLMRLIFFLQARKEILDVQTPQAVSGDKSTEMIVFTEVL